MWDENRVRELQRLLEGEGYPADEARRCAAQVMIYKGVEAMDRTIRETREATEKRRRRMI